MSTYTPIASVTLSSAQATVSFVGIPQTYTDLILVCQVQQSASNNSLRHRFNYDSASNYSYTTLIANGSSASSGKDSNLTVGLLCDTTASSGALETLYKVQIYSYANTTTYKTHLGRGGRGGGGIDATVGLWRKTEAITSIELAMGGGFPTNNFASGSTFHLYGVANASITNVAKAIGGNSITTDGTYWYHTFLSSGIFTPTQALTADVLVVAGGGGSGRTGGGGGAGGLRGLTAQSLTTTSYSVSIGGGGAGGDTDGGVASNGTNSVFGNIVASGGGGGASYNGGNAIGVSGGSGGGGGTHDGGSATRTGGAGNIGGYTPVEGFAGGAAVSTRGSGGGGGATAAGTNAPSTNNGGAGGTGSSAYSSWGVATGTGQNSGGTYYFGGGGGGSGLASGGAAGLGGGAAGSTYAGSSNQPGAINTGGGAGGINDRNGSTGGSGIVIVRYAV